MNLEKQLTSFDCSIRATKYSWIPACAGMTEIIAGMMGIGEEWDVNHAGLV